MNNYIFIIFIVSFLINMVVMPAITLNSYDQITINMNKIYLSTILGLLIVIVHVIMLYNINGEINTVELAIYIGLLSLYIYLYRNQLFIDDDNFLNYMKENRLTEVLINSNIKKFSKNNKILSYTNFILTNSTKELDFINKELTALDK